MIVELTTASLKWLEDHQISFHNRFKVRLRPGDKVQFKDALTVEPYVGFHAGYNLYELGLMSYSNSSLPLDIKVGRYCSLAWGIDIPSYNHPHKCVSTSLFTHDSETDLVMRFIEDFPDGRSINYVPNLQKGPITIDNDVWIGQHAALLGGIKIGTGSVVAAHSVVTKSVPPYAVVGGNPARIIRYRFPPDIVQRLLISKWWEYKFTDFADLDLHDPERFATQFELRRPQIAPYHPQKIVLAQIPM
jgi:acetyltransferase-like isoleucine patch superfamily enzyme